MFPADPTDSTSACNKGRRPEGLCLQGVMSESPGVQIDETRYDQRSRCLFFVSADITSARRWHRLQSCPSFESLVWKDLFYDFGSDDTHLVAGNKPFVLKEDEDFAVVRARVNYHFNSGY